MANVPLEESRWRPYGRQLLQNQIPWMCRGLFIEFSLGHGAPRSPADSKRLALTQKRRAPEALGAQASSSKHKPCVVDRQQVRNVVATF